MMLPTIVFVHLNSPIPLYLKLNIISTIKKFPNAKVVLIRNDRKTEGIHSALWHFEYKPGVTSQTIERSLSHPKDFRNNFWFSAIQRFDALRLYVEQNNEPILHFESDVIASKDFPLEKFITGGIKIAYPVVAKNRGVASSIFIRDLETIEKLAEFAKELSSIDSQTTDMEILAEFFESNQEITFPLAFGPSAASAYQQNFKLEKIRSSLEWFEGVFDGNDIGVYLFGTDPRNSRGVSFLRTSIQGNYASISTWQFKFDKSRNFINLVLDNSIIPIYSFHATSKQIILFYGLTQKWVIRRYLKTNKTIKKRKFYPVTTIVMGVNKALKLLKI